MEITSFSLPGLRLIRPKRFTDDRGYFCETYNRARYVESGILSEFVQDNHSLSIRKGTLRGLHFQNPPKPQAKLVRCTRGRILDIAVDLRRSSSTFLKHEKVELSASAGEQLFLPDGFAHGFLTLEDDTEVQYKVSAPFDSALDAGVSFKDPDLAIDWGIPEHELTLSEKDKALPFLSEQPSPFK